MVSAAGPSSPPGCAPGECPPEDLVSLSPDRDQGGNPLPGGAPLPGWSRVPGLAAVPWSLWAARSFGLLPLSTFLILAATLVGAPSRIPLEGPLLVLLLTYLAPYVFLLLGERGRNLVAPGATLVNFPGEGGLQLRRLELDRDAHELELRLWVERTEGWGPPVLELSALSADPAHPGGWAPLEGYRENLLLPAPRAWRGDTQEVRTWALRVLLPVSVLGQGVLRVGVGEEEGPGFSLEIPVTSGGRGDPGRGSAR